MITAIQNPKIFFESCHTPYSKSKLYAKKWITLIFLSNNGQQLQHVSSCLTQRTWRTTRLKGWIDETKTDESYLSLVLWASIQIVKDLRRVKLCPFPVTIQSYIKTIKQVSFQFSNTSFLLAIQFNTTINHKHHKRDVVEFTRKEWRQMFVSVSAPMQRLQTFDIISSY